MSDQLAEWDEPQAQVTTLEGMDQLLARYRAAREDYDAKKKISNEANAVKDEIQAQVIAALKANNRTKYDSPDGLAYISVKEVYPTPKTAEEKQALFDYIESKYGVEALLGLQSINAQTLTAWANKEAEQGVMQIPGLQAPTTMETLNFRKG